MSYRNVGSLVSVGLVVALVGTVVPQAYAQQEGESSAAEASPDDESLVLPEGELIGVAAGYYTENSRREGEEVRQNETTDESFDYNADNFLNASLWYVTPVLPRVRAGGALQYFGGYEMMREPGEDEEAEEVEAYEFGQMANLVARIDWLIPFATDKQLALGAEAGGTVLFPDGDFRATLEDMTEENISVSEGPRLGVILGPRVGGRWQIDSRVAVRLDFSVQWQRLFLMSVDDSVDNVDYRRSWTGKILRYNLGVGMEVTL